MHCIRLRNIASRPSARIQRIKSLIKSESGCLCPACSECAEMYLDDDSESKAAERLRIMLPWDNSC